MIGFKRILCPTDYSEASTQALPYAFDLARRFNAEIYFVHVIDSFPLAPDFTLEAKSLGFAADLAGDPEQDLDRFLSGRVPPGMKVHKIVGIGQAAEEILRVAEENKIQLIIIATHGRTGWRHMVFGSVAEKVVRKANVPVLTVSGKTELPEREREREFFEYYHAQ